MLGGVTNNTNDETRQCTIGPHACIAARKRGGTYVHMSARFWYSMCELVSLPLNGSLDFFLRKINTAYFERPYCPPQQPT